MIEIALTLNFFCESQRMNPVDRMKWPNVKPIESKMELCVLRENRISCV